MSKERTRELLLDLCEQMHLTTARKLLEALEGMDPDEGAYDTQVINAAIKFLEKNGISLETGHYDPEIEDDDKPKSGSTPLMKKLGDRTFPFKVKRDSQRDERTGHAAS